MQGGNAGGHDHADGHCAGTTRPRELRSFAIIASHALQPPTKAAPLAYAPAPQPSPPPPVAHAFRASTPGGCTARPKATQTKAATWPLTGGTSARRGANCWMADASFEVCGGDASSLDASSLDASSPAFAGSTQAWSLSKERLRGKACTGCGSGSGTRGTSTAASSEITACLSATYCL
eukprot:CAMPEP_0176091834 /NCGR_PEP_ID=MMETSP0120_2-20121206/46001_1 /TAXON_ID=160619 /ORGANISM="Kryptoperidinium foliaceum, Strain CCMP 1326" /LENGTH=177 /DNA_ID=CAMNT_0017425735 /DNA_START=180 /DNA_END=714 /DNA_ORIENTATION=+